MLTCSNRYLFMPSSSSALLTISPWIFGEHAPTAARLKSLVLNSFLRNFWPSLEHRASWMPTVTTRGSFLISSAIALRSTYLPISSLQAQRYTAMPFCCSSLVLGMPAFIYHPVRLSTGSSLARYELSSLLQLCPSQRVVDTLEYARFGHIPIEVTLVKNGDC